MLPWNKFPFNEEMKKMLDNKSANDIDKYVHEMISKMLPKNFEAMVNPQAWMAGMPNHQQHSNQDSMENSKLQAAIFATHDFVFIRISIKDEQWLKSMRIFHTSHELIIENIPNPSDKNTYPLPVLVRKKGATASYQENILEIRIPRAIQTQISEVPIPDS